MGIRHIVLLFIYVAITTCALAVNVFACACCAEPGTYSLRTVKPDSYYLDILSRLEFSQTARLYMTEAGFETIKGLDQVKKEDEAIDVSITDGFDIAAAFTGGRSWRFELKSPKGLKGSLTLPIPAQMVSFAVDIHDAEESGLGPLLYKEFRFKGNVAAATGFTKAGVVRGTSYFLVFQGRGRGCNEVSDFSNWRLEIVGPRVQYAFFGKLSSADKP